LKNELNYEILKKPKISQKLDTFDLAFLNHTLVIKTNLLENRFGEKRWHV